MIWRSRPEAWALALGLAAVLPGTAAAQGWTEVQFYGVGLDARPRIVAGGFGFAWRDRGRTRIGAALAGGGTTTGGLYAVRGEIAWHFLLDPARRSGITIYGGGGMAVTAVENGQARPWILMVLGLETAPAARSGLFIEGGYGGGARVAAGLRFRSRRPPSR